MAGRRKDTFEERALKRQLKVEAMWGDEALDKSWMRWAKCVLCKTRFCVNNYEDREVRDTRIFKRWVCPWCMGHGGKDNLRRLLIVEKIVKDGVCTFYPGHHETEGELLKSCKCAYHVARRLFGEPSRSSK